MTTDLDALCADLSIRGIRFKRYAYVAHVLPGSGVQAIEVARRGDGQWRAAPSRNGYVAREADPLLAIRRIAIGLLHRAKTARSKTALQALIDALPAPTPTLGAAWPATPRADLLDLLRRADLIIAGLLPSAESSLEPAFDAEVERWISDSRGPIAEACGEPVEPAAE